MRADADLLERISGHLATTAEERIHRTVDAVAVALGAADVPEHLLTRLVRSIDASLREAAPDGVLPEGAASLDGAEELARRVLAEKVDRRLILVASRALERAYIESLMDTLASVTSAPEFRLMAPQVLNAAFAFTTSVFQSTLDQLESLEASAARWDGLNLGKQVQAVLDGTVTNPDLAERITRFPLKGLTVAGVMEGRDGALGAGPLAAFERRLRGLEEVERVLTLPQDSSVLYWCALAGVDVTADLPARLRPLLPRGARGALGTPGRGIESFRRTAQEARAAMELLAASGRPETLVNYADVAAVCFLADDAGANRWVEGILGRLASPDPDVARFRDTLRVFIRHGESASTTAETLFIHRNTVKYRVAKAIALLGVPFEQHRLDVALALEYSTWLGATLPE